MCFGFSQRLQNRYGNGISFRRCTQDTRVPEAKMFSYSDMVSKQDSLHVPNGEEVPMGSEYMMSYGNTQDMFACPDGTVLDTRTGKILRNGYDCRGDNCTYGYRMMENPFGYTTGNWNDTKINSFNPYVSEENPNGYHLNDDDIEYQKYSEMKNRELLDNMSDEQKRLLGDLENGMFLRKSRLIEERNI